MLTTTGKFATFGLLLLVTCTGCLREPFHGKTYNSRNDEITFFGFWGYPDRYVEIQVRNPGTGGWEYLTSTIVDDYAYNVPSGKWYFFEAKNKIPYAYWEKKSGKYAARIRAMHQNGAMLTFDASFKSTMAISVNGPLGELLKNHHHGQELTIYAKN